MVLQHHHINIFDPLCRVTQESVFSPSKTIRAYRFFPFRIRTPDSPPNEIDASVFHGKTGETPPIALMHFQMDKYFPAFPTKQ